METPAPPPFPPAQRRGAAVVAAAVVALVLGLLAAGGPASGQVGGPIGPGSTTTEDETTTTTEATTTTDEATTTTGRATSTTATPGTTVPAADGDAVLVSEDDSGVGRAAAAIGAVVLGVVALGLGLLIGIALGRRRSPPAAPVYGAHPGPAPTPAPAPAPPSAPPATPIPAAGGPLIGPAPDRDTDRLRTQRDGLVASLVELRDQLPSDALRDEVGRSLASAGVTELHPDGEPFDPAVHRAVAQRPTTDVALHNTVAATERPGYLDGSRVLRQPEVVVHRVDGQPVSAGPVRPRRPPAPWPPPGGPARCGSSPSRCARPGRRRSPGRSCRRTRAAPGRCGSREAGGRGPSAPS